MKITQIAESGSNNLLLYAIKNGVDPCENYHLSEMVNGELHYNVTIEGVNFYELFRLSQTFRNDLRVIRSEPIQSLDPEELSQRFGKAVPEEFNAIMEQFITVSEQIQGDDDFTDKIYSRLVLPMILTKYTIQVPYGFGDVINSLSDQSLSATLFSKEYPNNLQSFLEFERVQNGIMLQMEANLRNITYPAATEKLIMATKYKDIPPSGDIDKDISVVKLVSFEKYDTVSRRIIRNSMFNADVERFKENMKTMASMREHTKYSFAIQLPIFLMQIIESTFPTDIVDISFRSSAETNMIDNGYYLPEDIQRTYGVRVNFLMIENTKKNLLYLLNRINDPQDDSIDNSARSSVTSLLPAATKVNAVVTISTPNIESLMKHPDPNLANLFGKMNQITFGIESDVQKMRR
jgi:hypothetical protein